MDIKKYKQAGMSFVEVRNQKLRVVFSNLGASIYEIDYEDVPMTMTFKDPNVFKKPNLYMGKTVGRVAGRIKDGRAQINNRMYFFAQNEGKNCLHGGMFGLSTAYFNEVVNEGDDKVEVIYSYRSYHLESGFPGNLELEVIYRLYKDSDKLDCEFVARSDEDTLLNLTNHSFFILGEKNLDNISLEIKSHKFIEVNKEDMIPERIKDVDETTDFSSDRKIMEHVNDSYLLDAKIGGYDMYYIFDEVNSEIPQVTLHSDKYQMDIYTSYPGIQIYSDNFYDGEATLLADRSRRRSIALEPSLTHLQDRTLKRNVEYKHFISYVFGKYEPKPVEPVEEPEEDTTQIALTVEKMLAYATCHLGLDPLDVVYYRNYLLARLGIKEPSKEEINIEEIKEMKVPDQLVGELNEYLQNKGMDNKEIDRLICELFGTLSPNPSKFNEIFWKLYGEDKKSATDYFFDLSIKNNYVQKSKIDQNIIFEKKLDDHDLVVTINLSKPEKSNKDIRAALLKKDDKANYPECVICIENEGCYGSKKTPPRQNLRLVPLKLDGRDWYMQYSPYGYYNEHCIVILKEHVPMEVNKGNIQSLFDFVDIFPHYFIGANADLPIVGGSILSHEHFQGGNYDLPLLKAECGEVVSEDEDVKISILKWPSFVLALEGKDSHKIVERMDKILGIWRNYSDEEVNIIANDGEQHNTVTSIVKKVDDRYVAYMIPRNNRTTEERPDGLFHVDPSRQIIKSEGIGLIEAMGLFILPPRLKRQLKSVEEIVADPNKREEIYAASEDIKAFDHIINDLIDKKYEDVNDMLASVCNAILSDISVFKADEKGQEAMKRFIEAIK